MKKVVAVLLSLCIMSASLGLAGCSKNNQTTTETSLAQGDVDIVIDEDGLITETPDESWYIFNEYRLESEFFDANHNQIYNDIISVDDTYISTLVSGYYYNGGGLTYMDDGFSSRFCNLVTYNYKTDEQILCVDLSEYADYCETDGVQENYEIITAIDCGDVFYSVYRYTNYSSGGSSYHLMEIDKATGEIISDTEPEQLNEKLDSGTHFFGTCVGGDNIVFFTGNYGGTTPPFISSPRLVVFNPVTLEASGTALGSGLTANNAYYVQGIRRIDDTHFGVLASTDTEEPICVILDSETMETSTLDYEAAIDGVFGDDITVNDIDILEGSNVRSNAFAITVGDYSAKLNIETMKFEKIFDKNHCNMNDEVLDNSGIVYFDDELTVMADGLLNPYDTGCILGIYTFEKTPSNPYAGRKLLTASVIGRYMSREECQIIYQYNDSQDEYFIAVDNTYTPDISGDVYWDDYNQYVSELSEITAQLAVDLMAGGGPDIVLNSSEYLELNRNEYLMDLMPYLEDMGALDDEVFFAKVFSAVADENGELYQAPIGFCINGLTDTIGLYDSYNDYGWTFEEYEEFVEEDCNGYDPLSIGRDRLDYFVLLFSNMSNLFISNGQVDLDNEAFTELATHCMENVFDGYDMDSLWEETDGNIPTTTYAYTFWPINVMRGYYRVPNRLSVVRGLPSYDGRGVRIGISSSIGVSAQCSDVDGALDFLEYALSYDSQREFGEVTVRRDALQEYMTEQIAVINLETDRRLLEDPSDEWAAYTSQEEMDLMYAIYSDMVSQASGPVAVDSDVAVIIYEEMGPYFAGDKTLEQIIPIIENRIQTVLDERS